MDRRFLTGCLYATLLEALALFVIVSIVAAHRLGHR